VFEYFKGKQLNLMDFFYLSGHFLKIHMIVSRSFYDFFKNEKMSLYIILFLSCCHIQR